MSASATVIANTKTVITNGPNSASLALAARAAGPIMDYQGNMNALLLYFEESDVLLKQIKTDTDSGDTANLALINKVLAALEGTSTPSTTYITDIKTVYTNGPSVATKTLAIAPAGPIMDYLGNVKAVQRKLEEAAVLIGRILTDTDSSDSANLTLLQNINAGLV